MSIPVGHLLCIITILLWMRTFLSILSILSDWLSNSAPISDAMFFRKPIDVFTCLIFPSISVSRSSLVILHEITFSFVSIVYQWTNFNDRDLLLNVSTLRCDVWSFEHALRLFVYYFTVIISFPRDRVFLERCRPGRIIINNTAWQYNFRGIADKVFSGRKKNIRIWMCKQRLFLSCENIPKRNAATLDC